MNTLTFTKHAEKRQKQRNIRTITITLLQEFGRKVYDHRGGYRLFFDKRAQAAVRERLGKAAAQLRLDTFAVFDAHSSRIITAGYLTRRVKEGA